MITNPELRKLSDSISSLIQTAEATFDVDDEMRSHMAKYVCILCSGLLENAIQHVYVDYIKTETTSASIIAFTTTFLSKIQNPNAEKFRETAKNFKPEWGEHLKTFLQAEERSSAINYIIRERHRIAHGKDSDITLIRIKEYHSKAVELIIFLEMQCGLIAPAPVVPEVEPIPEAVGATPPGAPGVEAPLAEPASAEEPPEILPPAINATE